MARSQQMRRMGRQDQAGEEKQFDERTLNIDRVARVVKGGRRFRFRALVVVGDHKGRVGIGVGKGADVTAAITKATDVAKKGLITVPFRKGTLPHEVEAKVSGARIMIKPASPGTGLIAGSVIRTIIEVAGVSDVLSKSLGSSNKINMSYATMTALGQLVPAKDWVTPPRKSQKQQTTENLLEPKAKPVKTPTPTKTREKKK
ncbi:MAG: 30S ribosomal protein S5 [Candidatus Saccharimonadales bacterium]